MSDHQCSWLFSFGEETFWQVAVVDHVEHHAAWAAQCQATHSGLADRAFVDAAQVRKLPPVQASVLADAFDLSGGHATHLAMQLTE